LVLLAAVGGPAAAASFVYADPAPAQVGQSYQFSASIEEPFRDLPDQWTLQGQTDLENATWTVQVSAQGEPVANPSASGGSFNLSLDQSDNPTPTLVNVTVSGDVPPIDTYSYSDRASENISVMSINQISDGTPNELREILTPRYTEESRQARQAIDAAIEAVGGRNAKIEQAISAYNTGNFGNAVSRAEEAESGAQSGQLLLYAAIGVVAIVVIAGAVYYWRQRRDTGYKLQ
jgi:hypothetical protein